MVHIIPLPKVYLHLVSVIGSRSSLKPSFQSGGTLSINEASVNGLCAGINGTGGSDAGSSLVGKRDVMSGKLNSLTSVMIVASGCCFLRSINTNDCGRAIERP